MATITIAVSEKEKKFMDEHPEIKWSEVLRNAILHKLEQLKKFEELVKRGEL
ncbi:MAG: hypothetical protein Q8L34_02080 [Candidatus Woesearchaeota archaeon]|nr:hypothetical protein [Candidatus Woesearchaeota archaeon]